MVLVDYSSDRFSENYLVRPDRGINLIRQHALGGMLFIYYVNVTVQVDHTIQLCGVVIYKNKNKIGIHPNTNILYKLQRERTVNRLLIPFPKHNTLLGGPQQKYRNIGRSAR